MTIAELRSRSKAILGRIPKDILVVSALVLASSASFGVGMLAQHQLGQIGSQGGIWVEKAAQNELKSQPVLGNEAAAEEQTPLPGPAGKGSTKAPKTTIPKPPAIPTTTSGQVVASKTGTKYFLPHCGGAKLIKESNKVWFASAEEAKAKGYAPASNCKGL